MIACTRSLNQGQREGWHDEFLKMLPTIVRQAKMAFRGLDPEAREDAVTEVIAHATCMYRRLYERNELHRAFATVIAKFAIKNYWRGRRCGTSQCSNDVCSSTAQQLVGYELCSLGAPGDQVGEWMECLVDNRVTSIPYQVAFRLDFPRWLDSQSPRVRRIAERLSLGYSTSEVASEFKVSAGRISQLRRQLADSWYEFISVKSHPLAAEC
jgi:DNA-directed RNA polymerase specialized sigma24 family protein